MKKIHEGLKRKVLCSILAAAAIGVSTSAWAATNVIGTVKVGDAETAVTTTTGTFTVGESGKTLSVESTGDAISLYNQNDNGTFLGSDITINSTGSGTVGINAGLSSSSATPYATVVVGDKSTESISVNANYTAVQALRGHVTLNATDEVNITSTGDFAVWVQNNTQTATAPEGASSVDISAAKVNITGKEGGIVAFSNGQVNISGDTTIDGGNGPALDVRGNSTVNINADGKHSTVIKGDIIFETPNTEQDSVNSGNIVNASVNLNLSGEGSSWTGSAYQEFKDVDHGVNVSGNNQYYGDVTGLSVSISDGASWNMTEDSFVNNATVGADSAINVTEDVQTFNAAEVDLNGGALNAEGGTTTINTLNASDDSTVNLKDANLAIGGGTAEIAEFNASGTSTLALSGDAKVTVESGDAELSSITSGGSASLTVGSEANVKTDEITVSDSSTLTVDSGAVVESTTGVKVTGNSSTVTLNSGSTLTGNLYLLSENAQNNSTVAGSFNGTIYSSDSQTLGAEAIKKLVGYTAADTKATGGVFDIHSSNTNHTVQMSVSDEGTFAIKSYDFSKASDGKVQTAELGTWDAEGNYSANTHNISNVGTLSANTIKLGGADLAETLTDMSDTLDAKANRDMDNLTSDGINQVKDYAQAALEVKNAEKSGVIVSSKEDETNHKTTYTVSLDAETIGTAVGDGTITKDNTHLVTGGTLYTELRPTSADLHTVSGTNTTAQNLEALDSAVYGLTNMNNLTDVGKTAIRDIAEKSVIVKQGKNVKVTSSNADNDYGAMEYTVDVEATGSIAASNEGLVNGGGLYTELRDISADAKIVSAEKTTAENLEALGAQVSTNQTNIGTNADAITALKEMSNLTDEGKKQIRSLATEAVTVGVGDNLTLSKAVNDTTGNITYTVGIATTGEVKEGNTGLVTGGAIHTAITDVVDEVSEELDTKANIDASNIGTNLKDKEGKAASEDLQNANLDLWGKALGTGTVSAESYQLINGKTLYGEVRLSTDGHYVLASNTAAQNLTALDGQVYTNTTDISDLKKMSNLADEGKSAIKTLAKEAVKVAGGTNVSIAEAEENGNKTYTVNVAANGTVDATSEGLVSGKTVNEAISKAIEDSETGTAKELATKANVDASNIGKKLKTTGSDDEVAAATQANLDAWGEALGTGTVAANSKQLITGATLYGEVRLANNGHYVLATNSAAQNLTALDDQVYTNTGNISTNTDDIADLKNLSNISTDAKKVIQNANKLVEGDYITLNQSEADKDGNITTTISVKAEGVVEENNTGLVTGGTVDTAIKTAISNSESGTDAKLANKVNLDASNIGNNFVSTGSAEEVAAAKEANLDAWGKALGTGKVASGETAGDGSEQLVTGKTMYDELRPENGTYVQKDQTTAVNLKKLDDQVTTNTEDISKLKDMSNLSDKGINQVKTYAQQAVKVEGSTGITVTPTASEDGTNTTYKISFDKEAIGSEIGTGKVEEGNTGLVTGGTVSDAIKKELGEGVGGSYIKADATVNANLKALDTAIGEKYNSTNNILEKDDVKTSIGKLDAAIGQVDQLKDIKGLGSSAMVTDDSSTTVVDAVLKLNEKMGDLNPDPNTDYNVIDGGSSMATNLEQIDKTFGAVKSLYGENGIIKDKKGDTISDAAFEKGGLTTVMQTLDGKIGDLDQKKTYNVIQSQNSVNANLDLIDTKIGTTADGAYVSSGYSIGQNLNALDRGLSDLGDRVNKVGAGAAALASLHGEAFNPDDKLSFAVGFGHYKNANASAIGAFYKPNENTTFSVASTVGNGNTMVNAGISFKLGKSAHVEKTMVAKADYEALQQKVAAQDEKMAAQDEKLQAQDAQIEELKKQVALLVAKG